MQLFIFISPVHLLVIAFIELIEFSEDPFSFNLMFTQLNFLLISRFMRHTWNPYARSFSISFFRGFFHLLGFPVPY